MAYDNIESHQKAGSLSGSLSLSVSLSLSLSLSLYFENPDTLKHSYA